MKRDYYILAKAFRSIFTASVMSSLIIEITCITDGVVVSHFVNADAFAAVGLAMPVLSFLLIFTTILSFGATLIASKMVGEQKFSDAGQMVVLGTGFIALLYLILGGVLFINNESVARLITVDERLLPPLMEYMPLQYVNLPVIAVLCILDSFVKLGGRPTLVTLSAVVASVVNIVLDVLFVGVFGMGVAGASWATLAANASGIMCFIPYLRSDGCIFRFSMPNLKFIGERLGESFKSGAPYGVNSVSNSVMMMGLNAMIQKAAGADGVFVMAVGMQMMMVCTLITSGADNAILTIGGVLLGEKDTEGYSRLVKSTIKKTSLVIFACSILLVIFPDLLPKAFGASGDFLERVREPLQYFALIFAPMCVFLLRFGSFTVLEHRVLSTGHSIGMALFVLGCVFAAITSFPQYIWQTFAICFWVMVGLSYLASWLYSLITKKDLHWLTLVSRHTVLPCISRAVAYSQEEVDLYMKEFEAFLVKNVVSDNLRERVMLCLNELCRNVVNASSNDKKKRYFDVRLVLCPEEIVASVKDDNNKRNPVCETVITDDICNDINYTYINQINNTYLKFSNNKNS